MPKRDLRDHPRRWGSRCHQKPPSHAEWCPAWNIGSALLCVISQMAGWKLWTIHNIFCYKPPFSSGIFRCHVTDETDTGTPSDLSHVWCIIPSGNQSHGLLEDTLFIDMYGKPPLKPIILWNFRNIYRYYLYTIFPARNLHLLWDFPATFDETGGYSGVGFATMSSRVQTYSGTTSRRTAESSS